MVVLNKGVVFHVSVLGLSIHSGLGRLVDSTH